METNSQVLTIEDLKYILSIDMSNSNVDISVGACVSFYQSSRCVKGCKPFFWAF